MIQILHNSAYIIYLHSSQQEQDMKEYKMYNGLDYLGADPDHSEGSRKKVKKCPGH